MIEHAPALASAQSFLPSSLHPTPTAHEDLEPPDPLPDPLSDPQTNPQSETEVTPLVCTEECNAKPLPYTSPPSLSWNLSETHLSSLNPVPRTEDTGELITGR